MTNKSILTSLIIIFLLSGCTTIAHIDPPSNSVSNKNIPTFISKNDLTIKSSDLGSTYGTFPVDFELGEALKAYSESYLGKVNIGDADISSLEGAYVSLKSFDVKESMEGLFREVLRAILEIEVTVKGENGKIILSKIYRAEGAKLPVSSAASVTVQLAEASAASAFTKIFENIAEDIERIKTRQT